MPSATSDEEVVGQSHAVPGDDLTHFMLAVAVERSPLHCRRRLAIVRGPIKPYLFPRVADDKLTTCSANDSQRCAFMEIGRLTFVCRWKGNDETANLILASGRIDVRLELAAGCTVDVELVRLGLR